MVDKPKRTPEAEIIVPPSASLPNPEAANFFQFTYAGPDFQLLVGYVDLHDLHLANQRQREAASARGKLEIKPAITHRLSLSIRGFLLLKQQIDDIFATLQTTGMLVKEEVE